MANLTKEERETTITWNAAERLAYIDTADPALIRKLDKLAAQYPDTYRETCRDDDFKTRVFEVDARYIRFGKPASEARREHGRRLGESNRRRINSAPVD